MSLFEPVSFRHGAPIANRFGLAPLTNQQSHDDGSLGDGELQWLKLRAEGGFGLVTTCATHVQANGQGFAGQLATFDDRHIPGLERLATAVRRAGACAIAQIYHAGVRAAADLVDERVGPSDDPEAGARGLSLGEVEQLVEDFAAAARRCQQAGFDGVNLHGAHSYLITQFLSERNNRRQDRYGGDLEGRSRFLLDVIDAVRGRCGADFKIGVRMSPERFGLKLEEMLVVVAGLLRHSALDYVDISMMEVRKEPEEEPFKGRSLLSYFTALERQGVRLAVAGSMTDGVIAADIVSQGVDFLLIGRAGILHPDFPRQVGARPDFAARPLPVTAEYLASVGVSPPFVDYLRTWPGTVVA